MTSSASPADRPTGTEIWLGRQTERARAELNASVPPLYRAEIDLPAKVTAWASTPTAASLFITGKMGRGKTHAAWQAIRVWHDTWLTGPGAFKRPRIEAWRSTALFDALRPEADEDGRHVARRCQQADLLYLDDIAAAKASEFTRERLFEIIDERYCQQRPVLMTSDVFPAKLNPFVGDRVASRLGEMLGPNVVLLCGGDRRTGGGA